MTMFTKRELEVCGLLIMGFNNKKIASELQVPAKQITTYKSRIKGKLEIPNDKNDFYIVKEIILYFHSLSPIKKTILYSSHNIKILGEDIDSDEGDDFIIRFKK